LVLIIKTALLPLTYKSYVSMAKTRILAPEIAAIKEKIGDDAARVQQETMKLYGEVGVNPLSGCIPVLATMPVLMAVFMLFPNLINLRQESFLWAEDLSTFDSILNLPFNIPFYGSHISMFCLLMTVSQLAYGYDNGLYYTSDIHVRYELLPCWIKFLLFCFKHRYNRPAISH
jgi:YidC/Oxa1 family membrane protein insertase